MYKVRKRLEISAAHRLELDYDSKCTCLHGHNWIIEVSLVSESLNQNGMILDFSEIKKLISEPLDHKVLNEVFPFNPTAENIAKWVYDRLSPFCCHVSVQESENNVAEYYDDRF